jgi:hypothetical protein
VDANDGVKSAGESGNKSEGVMSLSAGRVKYCAAALHAEKGMDCHEVACRWSAARGATMHQLDASLYWEASEGVDQTLSLRQRPLLAGR